MVTFAPWPQWPFDIACYTLLAIGVPLLIWAWCWDRPRGRNRCPKCWYNLAGLTIPADRTQSPCTCPECGREVRSVRESTRTRQRHMPLVVAILMLVASPIVWRAPQAHERGWRALEPTTLVAFRYQLFGVGRFNDTFISTPEESEFSKRVTDPATWTWQRRWLMNVLAPGYVHVRSPSPLGLPIYVSYGPLTPISPVIEPHYPPRPSHEQVWRDRVTRLDPLPAGWHELLLEVSHPDGFKHTLRMPFLVRGTPSDSISPMNNSELDVIVRQALAPRLMVYTSTSSVVVDVTSHDDSHSRTQALHLNVTVALRITARYDEREMATGRWMRPQEGRVRGIDPIDLPALLEGRAENLDQLRAAINSSNPAERARWTFTFTGDGELALSDVHSNTYWAGSFTMTLDELLASPQANTPAPAPSKNTPNK